MAAPDETRHDNDADDSHVAAAGRLAFYPARVAARASRDRIEAAVEEWLTGPEGTQALDRLLAGPLPEELARLVVKHRVLERMASELAASGDLELLADQALESDRLALPRRRQPVHAQANGRHIALFCHLDRLAPDRLGVVRLQTFHQQRCPNTPRAAAACVRATKNPARSPARAAGVLSVNTLFWKILVTRVKRILRAILMWRNFLRF